MASEVKRKKGESFEAFFRRVKDTWRRSDDVARAREVQFFQKKQSKNVRKKARVAGIHRGKKKAYLQKVGKLPLDPPKFGRRRR